jgi:hypothetical protein
MQHKLSISVLTLVACSLTAAFSNVGADATETKPEWAVKIGAENRILKSGETEVLSEKITTNVNWVLKQTTGRGVTVECSIAEFTSEYGASTINGPKGIAFKPLFFAGCKVTGFPKCQVSSTGYPNGDIRTQLLGFATSEALEGTTGAPKLALVPGFGEENHEEIVTLQIKGGEALCGTFEGGYEIKGKLVANIDTSALQKAHKWEFTKTSGTKLTFGGVEASFTGAGEFTLKSGNEWGEA